MSRGLRVLVLEDEVSARDYLVKLLRTSAQVALADAVATVADARRRVLATNYDALLADIHLAPDGDTAGLTFAQEVVEHGLVARIVFTTALDFHALQAFELGVVDYLLKPFTRQRLDQTLTRLLLAAPTTSVVPRKLVARRATSLVLLDLDDVVAIEAAERLTYAHTAADRLLIDVSLATFEQEAGAAWLRVHRSWLVRTASVRSIERGSGDLILRVGSATPLVVPVARERAASVREAVLRGSLGRRFYER